MNLAEIVEGLPPTILAYQDDPYCASAEGTVLRFARDQGSSYYLVLASSIFHPKGGGQPSDTGVVEGEGFTFRVKKALKGGDHVILYGKCDGTPALGPCREALDWDQRYLYMRRHAAAHLFDGVLAEVTGQVFEPLDSWLGDGSYVAYRGEAPDERKMKNVEVEANRAISEGRPLSIQVVRSEDLSDVRTFWSSVLQNEEKIRLVTIQGYRPIPCAGTHVRNLMEVKGLKVLSTEVTADGFKVHFDVPHSV